jgi:phosphoribosylformylglycinamidine cyclo-ligase
VASRYSDAGVDRGQAQRAVAMIARAAAATSTPAVLGGVGGFGSLFRFEPAAYPDPVLVASTDSVGTKVKVAIALDRHDTVGVDIVNHCLNDVAVCGADPLFFLDYVGTGRLDADRVAIIVAGVADACAAAGVALVGGETAELPDLYAGDDYDLAGFAVGAVARRDLISGDRARPDDVLLGLPSTGLHTNGYSLARRILPANEWTVTPPGWTATLGDALLAPHRSYLDEMRLLRRAMRDAGSDVAAFAHLTGGGWVENIPRTLPVSLGVEVEAGAWPVPPIFTLIQQRGDVDDDEMVRVFNLGIGLTAVVPASLVDAAMRAVPEALPVGRVTAVGPGEPRVRFS